MAEETQTSASPTTEVVKVPDVPEPEKPVTEPTPEPEVPVKPVTGEPEPEVVEKIVEETNVVGQLPNEEKVALDELKLLVREALNKHEFTPLSPPPPPAVVKTAEEAVPSDITAPSAETPTEEPPKSEPEAVVEEEKIPQPPAEEKIPQPPAVVETKVVEKVETVDEKTVEAIKETIVEEVPPTEVAPPAAEQEAPPPPLEEVATEQEAPPPPPEEVSIWGIPLLADERSDVVLLKFLRARDNKVKEAFTMLKNVIAWRKDFGIDALLEEDFGTELDKFAFYDGVDKEGHPVCYNVYGVFQNKELYQSTFGDAEKRTRFLRWRIQLLEKSIRKLDFSPTGVNTLLQVNDLKDSPGFFTFVQVTKQVLGVLQDNYPEFVAKQV